MPDPCLGGLFGATLGTCIKPLCDCFIKHALYPFKVRRNISKLKKAINDWTAEIQDVEKQITDDRKHRGLEKTNTATNWLKEAKKTKAEAQTILQQYENRCKIFGCCSPNCLLNYKISKRAAELLRKGEKAPENLTVEPSLQAVVHIPVPAVDLCPSQDRFLNDARKCITDDAEAMIAIWGPPAVGKTLLLKIINNSFERRDNPNRNSSNRGDSTNLNSAERVDSTNPNSADRQDSPFDIIIHLEATGECSVKDIQSQIMERLKLRGDGSITSQAAEIFKFLYERSFLVLIDDPWDGLKLSEVGIPDPHGAQSRKQKVVIATRSRLLCDKMSVNKIIEVRGLEKNEARKIFEENFGEDNLYSDPHIGALAEGLVKELIGRPSELIHIGKLMRRKRDPMQWTDVIGVIKELISDDLDSQPLTARIMGKLVNKLRGRSDDVRAKIQLAERNCRKATNQINIWLTRAEEAISDGMVVPKANELNWDVSARAAKTLAELEECLNNQPSDISIEALPPPSRQMPVTSYSLRTREALLQESIQCVKDDSAGMIAIWGPGGVGKTHLLREINNFFDENIKQNSFCGDTFFDIVSVVEASEGCSVATIQEQIVEEHKLQKDGNVKSQAHIIFDFLNTKSFLILLDDMRDMIDLQKVGIPLSPWGCKPTQEESISKKKKKLRRKVVITTRSKPVCGKMQVRNYINVSCLPPDEAWHLFQSQVGQNLSSNSRIKALAEELVKELKGLPLALIAVGVAMHPKTEAEGWQHAVNHMKQSCCHIDCLSMEEEVFRKLRFSYDSLDGTLKRCFLTCSLWPKGRYISMDELVQCWMGLGILDDKCDIYSSYMTAHSLKGDLEAVCLLERGYGYSLFGIYNYNSVKMHDVVHDMALWIASESKDKWIVRAGVGPNSSRSTVPWSKTEYVSLMDNRMKELPPCGPNSGSKELKALYLQKNMMDQSIVGAIRSFMALTYLDLSFNNLQNIPQELCALANLEYLNLSYNLEINEVPECLGDLTKLKFLYLKETRISVIPKRVISRLEALQVVDLRTWTRGTFDPPIFRELCTITNLKAAGICVENCYEYELLNQAANIPIRFLTIQKLQESAFDLSVGTCSYDNVRMTLYELEIRECKLEQIKGGDLGNPFEALTRLCVYGCVWLQHISWAMYLPCLEYLRLDSCFRMKQAFPSTENHGVEMHKKSSKTSISTFPCLKHLSFFLNTKLASLCDSNVTFPNLETLEVFRCRKLKRLPFTMQSLPQKLRALRMNQFTWNALEWEEEGVESFLQRQLQFYR